jgi:HEAT repeat protein
MNLGPRAEVQAIGFGEFKDATINIKHRRENYRRRAVLDFMRLGDRRAVPHLIHALADPDVIVRRRAAEALLSLGTAYDGLSVPALVESLAGEKDETVYNMKIKALAVFSSSKNTVSALLSTFEAMPEEEKVNLLYHLHDLVNTNKAAFENFRPLFKDSLKYGNDKLRVMSLAAFGKNGGPFDREILLTYATHSDVNTRLLALQYLEGHRSSEAAEILVNALRDPFELVRTEALNTLSIWKDPTHFDHFAQMTSDVSPLVRRVACVGLGGLLLQDGQPYLRARMLDADRGVRLEAAHSLALLDQHTGFDVLVWNMRDHRDPKERRLAAHGLAVLDTRHAAPYFRQALRDRDLEVRRIARDALKKMGYR